MPKSNKYHSDIESHAAAQGFDSENISNPVSYYAAVAGFAIQGIGLLFLLVVRMSKKKSSG
jgi:hypothetical protein